MSEISARNQENTQKEKMEKKLLKMQIEYLIDLVKKDKQQINKEFKKDTIRRLKKLKRIIVS